MRKATDASGASVDTVIASDPAAPSDFRLTDLMTVDQAIELHPILRRGELLAAMRSGELRHWPKGRVRLTTARWIVDWVKPQLRGGDPDRNGIRTDTAERQGRGQLPTTSTTPREDEIAAEFSARSVRRRSDRGARRSQRAQER